jgi:hypothetical protein
LGLFPLSHNVIQAEQAPRRAARILAHFRSVAEEPRDDIAGALRLG